jgi:hypothetical protein
MSTNTSDGPLPDRGQPLIIMMWILTVLSSITVVMRFYFRLQKSIIGWDDLFMLLSMVRSIRHG